jgi:pimeloyl-ACP methyl ester carboxylesterase
MKEAIIRGCRVFYRDLNSEKSEIILLIHGHPFDNTMWDYQIDALSENFRLILPDLRGYGKSDHEFDKIFIEEQALDLAILLDSLQIEQVHLIGLSMGGQIGVEFCRLFPHRAKSLILCDSNPAAESPASYKSRLQMAERINSIGMTEYTRQDIYKYLAESTIENKKEVYKHLYRMMTATKTAGVVASHRGRAERWDNLGFLNKIRCPTMVIVGDSDFFTPVSEMKVIAELIPNARFEIIENSGHMPNMEHPTQFNLVMERFYKDVWNIFLEDEN